MSYKHQSLFNRNKIIVLDNANHICKKCGEKAVEVHHLDGSKVNHSFDNLVALCSSCHNNIHTEDKHTRNKGKLNSKAIEELLIKKGMNKSELAVKLHMHASSLSIMLKRGSTHARTIARISEILNCNINDILSSEYQRKPSNDGYQINVCIDFTEEQYNKAVILSKTMHCDVTTCLRITVKNHINNL